MCIRVCMYKGENRENGFCLLVLETKWVQKNLVYRNMKSEIFGIFKKMGFCSFFFFSVF